jgi:hypothetical protein
MSPNGPVAQLVEQGTFNPKVAGSIPARPMEPLDAPSASHSTGAVTGARAVRKGHPTAGVLEVADSPRGDVDLLQGVQRSDGSLVDDSTVDSRPDPVGKIRVARRASARPICLSMRRSEVREIRRTA